MGNEITEGPKSGGVIIDVFAEKNSIEASGSQMAAQWNHLKNLI